MGEIELPDGSYTAVVDSIEDGLARVFFEQDGEEVGDAVIDASQLPSDGRHADAILSVSLHDYQLETAIYKPEKTVDRAEEAQNRFDRLAKRPSSDEDN